MKTAVYIHVHKDGIFTEVILIWKMQALLYQDLNKWS